MTTTTYRAVSYCTPDGQSDTVLTSPEQSHLSDDDLIAAAIAEAYNGDIVSPDGDDSRISEQQLRDGLTIVDWQSSYLALQSDPQEQGEK